MDRLWAPWRIKYLNDVVHKKGCVFCRILAGKKDKRHFVFIRRKYCFAVLNLFPYNNGHSLVMPLRHVGNLQRLNKEESAELFELLNYTQELLAEVLSPDGFNIGMNIGRVAGAGVPGHIHFHIVPRWKGDINFMPVVNGTRVISQSLEDLYKKLSQAHGKRQKKSGKK